MRIATDAPHCIGYARVSTDDQDLALQLDALGKMCKSIYSEKVSGAKAVRPQLSACMQALRKGDLLVVWRLDRLSRSMPELLTLTSELEKKGVGLRSLTENIDTSSASGKLTFHMFSAMAEFERQTIKERTNAGLQAARARGRVGGRAPIVSKKDKREMLALYKANSSSVVSICKRYKISRSTFYRAVLDDAYKHPEDAR